MSIEPINPSEVLEIKDTLLPDEVIVAFNFLIAKNFIKHNTINNSFYL